jgi:large repetitive protein
LMADPDPISIVSESAQDVQTCHGDSTGSVSIVMTGGTGTIEYSLDGAFWQASGVFTNLPAGDYTIMARDENNCTNNSSLLTINEPAAISVTYAVEVYQDAFNKGSITILTTNGGAGNYTYSINGMLGPFTDQLVFDGLNEGNYTLIVLDEDNCSYIENIFVASNPPLFVNILKNDVNCYGIAEGSIEITALNPEGPAEYSIDDSASWHVNNIFTDLPAGTYQVLVRDTAQRYYSEEVIISEPSPINISGTITPASCNAYSSDGAVNIEVTGGTGLKTIQWQDGSGLNELTGLTAGTYLVSITDENLCVADSIFTVGYIDSVFAYAGSDTTMCVGTTITLEGQGASDYTWETLDGQAIAGTSPELTIDEALTIILRASNVSGCYNFDTLQINVFPQLELNAGNDTSVMKNNPVYLSATEDFVSYSWLPSSGLDNANIFNPVANIISSQIYVLTAVDANACVYSDTLSIHLIEKLIVYSSFSPNDDGINDFWDIDFAEFYPDILVEVYTRWGEQLFSSKGYDFDKRWNGTYKGKDVPIGTYYYVIVPYNGAEAITGPVTIVR